MSFVFCENDEIKHHVTRTRGDPLPSQDTKLHSVLSQQQESRQWIQHYLSRGKRAVRAGSCRLSRWFIPLPCTLISLPQDPSVFVVASGFSAYYVGWGWGGEPIICPPSSLLCLRSQKQAMWGRLTLDLTFSLSLGPQVCQNVLFDKPNVLISESIHLSTMI